jgi:ABC-type branched-subunit amino acid transport system substrate-binding protein
VKKLFLFPLLILLVIGFVLTGCGTTTPSATTPAQTQTSPPPTTQTTQVPTQTTQAPTQTTSTPSAGTWDGKYDGGEFVFGMNTDLTGSLGNQVMNIGDIVVGMWNAKGGVVVGGKHYQIKCITYSNDNDVNKGIAAVNRHVFQDKVKFIISHGVMADYACPITQPEKVLTYSMSTVWNTGFLDKYTYNFSMLGQATHEVAVAGYLVDNYPEIKPAGGLAFAMPDNAMGHQQAANCASPYKSLGCQPQFIYYPADQRDLSSMGTKIKNLNPAWFFGGLGKVEEMGLVTSAAYDAGYRGHYFTFLTSDIGLLAPVFKPEVLEGYITACSAMETGDHNGCLTQFAFDLKQAWIAKYGKWDYPDYMTTPMYNNLFMAIQKADSFDVDKVASVLHSGFEWDVPDGTARMITRPDMRTDGKTVDAVTDSYLKQVKNKLPVIIDHATPDKTLEYARRAWPPLAPGQTPSVHPPE